MLVTATIGHCLYHSTFADDVQPIPTETVNDSVRGTMRVKLTHSQFVLKSISLNAPQEIAGDETENELCNHFRLDFLRTCTLIEQMVVEMSLESVAVASQCLSQLSRLSQLF